MIRDKESHNRLRKYGIHFAATVCFCAVVILIGLRYAVVRVEAGSMESTLFDGDWMLQDRSIANLQRGDVVVFQSPWDHRTLYVKRAIAIGGDIVAVCAGRLYLNGRPFAESYARHAPGYKPKEEWWPTDRKEAPDDCRSDGIPVPPESIFVMGDNRDASTDSRIFGSVPLNLVAGRVLLAAGSSRAGDPVLSTRSSAERLRRILRTAPTLETTNASR
jgi:signal peptidase I